MDTLPNDPPVDDTALFAEVTGATVPEITQPQPAPSPGPTPDPAPAPAAPAPSAPAADPATVPSARLREESDRARRAEQERDELRQRLEALQNPKPALQPKAEVDPWANPKEFSKSVVDEAVAPLNETVRQVVFTYSKRDAVRDHGAEAVSAAEEALEQAVRAGQVNGETLKAQLSASLDPVGDVVRWHKRQSALTKVGDDPDKWLESELERRLSDPAEQAKILERIQKGAAAASGGAPATELPGKPGPVSVPSLRNIGTAAAPSPSNGNEPSDGELFASVTGRRRR